MIGFEDIVNSLVNGQFKQAIGMVKAMGWYRFTKELEQTELLDTEDKLRYICVMLRLDGEGT